MDPVVVDAIRERIMSKDSTGLMGLVGGKREEFSLYDFVYNPKNPGEIYFSRYSANQQCHEGFGSGSLLVACDTETGVHYIPEKEHFGELRVYYNWDNSSDMSSRDNMIAAIKIFNAGQNELYAQIKADIQKDENESERQPKKGLVDGLTDFLKIAASFIF